MGRIVDPKSGLESRPSIWIASLTRRMVWTVYLQDGSKRRWVTPSTFKMDLDIDAKMGRSVDPQNGLSIDLQDGRIVSADRRPARVGNGRHGAAYSRRIAAILAAWPQRRMSSTAHRN